MGDGEDYEISDNEMEQLKADAGKDATSLTPKCYMPIWIPVESPAERIQRAKEQFASVTSKVEMADTSGKDTDSNGKKESPLSQLLVEETGLTPSMKKLNVELKLMTEVMLLLPSPGERGRKASPRVTRSPEMRRRRKKLYLPILPPNLVVRLNLQRRKALRRAANHQPKLHLLMKLRRKKIRYN